MAHFLPDMKNPHNHDNQLSILDILFFAQNCTKCQKKDYRSRDNGNYVLLYLSIVYFDDG